MDRHFITRGTGTFLGLSIHSTALINPRYPDPSLNKLSPENNVEINSNLGYESVQTLDLVF
jgi:hypothetical protein